MSEIGEGASSAPNKSDRNDRHWLELNYCCPDGLPVEGRYIAVDGDGLEYAGKLNDKGGLCLNNLPAGSVRVELIPAVEESEFKTMRTQVKSVLDEMLAEKRAETEATDQRMKSMSGLQQTGEVAGAVGKGLWNGAVGLISFVVDAAKTAAEVQQYLSPINRLNNLLEATYKTYRTGGMTQHAFYQSLRQHLAEAEYNDLIELLGFDPRTVDPALFAEAYEITAFIATDADTLNLLQAFANKIRHAGKLGN